MKKVLGINELHSSATPVEYTCYGLGSCIGLFISDRVKGLSGGAHIALPRPSSESEFTDAETMIAALLEQLSHHGSDLQTLRAKLTGGSQLFESGLDIGKGNIEVVLRQLIHRRIFIAAMDVGGRVSRTARFNGESGQVKISTSEQKTYFI
jgi:chemotaxis protein CheD